MLNKRKCFLFFTILILLLFSMTVVSATDNSDSNATIEDTDTITSTGTVTSSDNNIQSDNEENYNYEDKDDNTITNTKSITKQDITNKDTKTETSTQISSYADLIQKVNDAKSLNVDEYTINLKQGSYDAIGTINWGGATGSIRKLIINGNCSQLDGKGNYQFMTLDDGYTLELNDVNLKNYHGQLGGAINNRGTVIIKDSSISGSEANAGGAIYNTGTLNLTRTTFSNNKVLGDSFATGGAIYSGEGATVILKGCIFTDNSAGYGGAIYNSKSTKFEVISSEFKNNFAQQDAAGIYSEGTNVKINISDSKFTENRALKNGGAISINTGIIYLYYSSFIRNSVYNTNYGTGGAIYNYMGIVFIISNNFIENSANHRLSIIDSDGGEHYIFNSSFRRNGYNYGIFYDENDYLKLAETERFFDVGHIAIYTDSSNTIWEEHDTLEDFHKIPDQSLRIYVNGSDNSIFSNNVFYYDYMDYRVSSYSDLVEAIIDAETNKYDTYKINLLNDLSADQTLTWGFATRSTRRLLIYGNGKVINGNNRYGFISVREGYTLILENIIFTNFKSDYGGVINNHGTVIVNNCTFKNNYATNHGGAIFCEHHSSLTVISSSFSKNHASSRGGAIHSKDLCTLMISNSSFYNNDADDIGGAILNNNQSCTIINCEFVNNLANERGGAIASHNYASLNITNSKFTGNHAVKGGAISSHSRSKLTLKDSLLKNNYATGYGGAIYNDRSEVTLTGSDIKFNNASTHGGGIFNNDTAKLTVNDVYFGFNYAKGYDGGAIYNNAAGILDVTRGTFEYNIAKSSGAAIYNDASKATVKYSDFVNNIVETDRGGAIVNIRSSNMTISNSDFTENCAKRGGGAIHNQNNANLNVNDCNFDFNYEIDAVYGGGAIYNNLGNITVKHSNFNNNSASRGGSIYNTVGSTSFVTDCNFMGNTPKNFEIHNNKIELVNDDNFISINKVKVYLEDDDTSVYYGNLNNYDVPNGYNIRLLVEGTNTRNFTNNMFVFDKLKEPTIVLNPITSVKYNTNVTFSGMLLDENLLPIHSHMVTLSVADETNETWTNYGYFSQTFLIKNIGQQVFKVIYGGTTEYHSTEAEIHFNVIKQETIITINTINNGQYHDNITITGTLKENGPLLTNNNNVKVTVNGETTTVQTDRNGYFTFKHKATVVGKNNVTVRFEGNSYYNGCEASATFTVSRKDTVITLDSISNAKYNDNVTITGTLKNVDGEKLINTNVKVRVNGVTRTIQTDENGIYTYNYRASVLGENNVTVIFNRNSFYNGCEVNASFVVGKKDTVIVLDAISNVKYNENVTISGIFKNADGTPLVNSNVVVTVNGVSRTAQTDDNGVFTFNYKASVVGKNNVTVSYSGNARYNGCEASATFTVSKKDTVIVLDAISNVKYNENVTISGIFKNADGTPLVNSNVVVTVNGVSRTAQTDDNGVFTFNYKASVVGKNNVTVSYSGNARYNGCEASATFTVSKKDTVIVLDAISNVKYNENVTISGIFKNADGANLINSKVIVTVNGVSRTAQTNSNGVFTFNYKASVVGKNNVTVSYSGNARYNGCEASATFTVSKKDTVIVLDAISNVKYNDYVTISGIFKNADGANLINSKVIVTVNGVSRTAQTNSNGVFTFNYKASVVGKNNVTVSYSGNARYNGCEASATFTVSKKDTVIVLDAISNVKYNDYVTISGIFKNADGTPLINSNVLVTVNGVSRTAQTNSNGVFTFNYKASVVGKNNVTVSYSGNARYNGCEDSITFNVDKKDTVITINPIGDVNKDDQVTVEGTLTNADGTPLKTTTVVVYVNENHHTIKTDNNGHYNYTFTAKLVEEYNIMVKYIGNTNYNAFNTTTTFKVKAA